MTRIVYIEHDGTDHEVNVPDGHSVMEGAIRNGIRGIDADCGGQCSCATCHVFVDPAWSDAVGSPASDEAEMLEFVLGADKRSRLSCQIKVDPSLEGLVVRVPERQGTG